MIIILEGPDGSGKSTLATKLSKQTGYPIIHRSKPETEEDKANMMKEYIDAIKSSKNFIFDRAWYSEIVYGTVMRDESVITYPQMYELEALLAKAGAMIIYCTAAPSVLWKRCLSRGEDYITNKDDFTNICIMYDTILVDMPHHIPVVTYEYQDL